MSLQQAPQSQYSMPDREKQLPFSDFEDLSASFRSLYKSVFEQSFSQQGEWPREGSGWEMYQRDDFPNVGLFSTAGAVESL